MHVEITMKNPDCVFEAISRAAVDSVSDASGLNEEEIKELIKSRQKEIEEQVSKWVKYGEYITIEIDTVRETARVIPAN